MTTWIARHLGLSMDEANLVITAAALLLSALVVAVPVSRRAVARSLNFSALLLGTSERRYRRWYRDTYRTVYNVYLNMQDTLDLHTTYIGLSIVGTGEVEERVPAALVLGDRSNDRLIITGDPGSGKSTLAKAYGVGILRTKQDLNTSDLRLIDQGRDREIPFYIPLRKLALTLSATGQLPGSSADPIFDYVVHEILVIGARLSDRSAGALLRRLLRQGRCLIFLDGLDEVPAEKLRAVRAAVADFQRGRVIGINSDRARLVLTCRPQNMLAIRADWLPSFSRYMHTLSPLRDDEIRRYAHSLAHAFVSPKTPDTYLAELRASGTLDYHRTPLVLAISTGLYVGHPDYRIPQSVSLLYQAMINDLLQRHDYAVEPVGFEHQFFAKDKYRLLSEFALHTARERGFGEFARRDLVAFGRRLATTMSDVRPRDVDDLVDEIVRVSGLIVEVSDGEFAIAHRSIHEYLVATRLAADPRSGTDELVERAGDPQWRQVILMYASLDHADDDRLLTALEREHLELAGHCLSGARPSMAVAERVVAALAGSRPDAGGTAMLLPALLSASRSPVKAVREAATRAVRTALSGTTDKNELLRRLAIDQVGLLRVLEGLSNTGGTETIALVPSLAAMLPDEPDVVRPLWSSLTSAQATRHTLSQIVGQLMVLAMSPVCFAELQNQPPYSTAWMTPEYRRTTYPFRKGHPLTSNIVTLLCWAATLRVRAPRTNRFLEAAYQNPSAFARIERDGRRTLTIAPFHPMRVFNILACVGVIVGAVVVVAGDPGALMRPYGWRSLLVDVGLIPLAFILHVAIYDWILRREPRTDDLPSLFYLVRPLSPVLIVLVASSVRVLLAPLLDNGAWKFLVVAPLVLYALWFLPQAPVFAEEKKLYLLRPNEFADVFDDPASAHWVMRDMLDPEKRRILDIRLARQRTSPPSNRIAALEGGEDTPGAAAQSMTWTAAGATDRTGPTRRYHDDTGS